MSRPLRLVATWSRWLVAPQVGKEGFARWLEQEGSFRCTVEVRCPSRMEGPRSPQGSAAGRTAQQGSRGLDLGDRAFGWSEGPGGWAEGEAEAVGAEGRGTGGWPSRRVWESP